MSENEDPVYMPENYFGPNDNGAAVTVWFWENFTDVAQPRTERPPGHGNDGQPFDGTWASLEDERYPFRNVDCHICGRYIPGPPPTDGYWPHCGRCGKLTEAGHVQKLPGNSCSCLCSCGGFARPWDPEWPPGGGVERADWTPTIGEEVDTGMLGDNYAYPGGLNAYYTYSGMRGMPNMDLTTQEEGEVITEREMEELYYPLRRDEYFAIKDQGRSDAEIRRRFPEVDTFNVVDQLPMLPELRCPLPECNKPYPPEIFEYREPDFDDEDEGDEWVDRERRAFVSTCPICREPNGRRPPTPQVGYGYISEAEWVYYCRCRCVCEVESSSEEAGF